MLCLNGSPRRLARMRVAVLLTAGAILLPAGHARAGYTAEALIRFTSNYIYRGYTKSDDDPTLQANLDLYHASGWFGGGWVSAVDFGDADVEANPYLGLRFDLTPDWRLAATAAAYFYDGDVMDHNAGYAEFMLQLAYRDIGALHAGVAPDYYGTGHTASDYGLDLRYPLTDTIEMSTGVGYQASREALNYDIIYGHVGVAWFAGRHLTLDLRYHDLKETNRRPHPPGTPDLFDENYADRPVVLSVSIGF